MAGQVVPFRDVHKQLEEISKLREKGFWFSTVHNETYHFFKPNQWIWHRDKNPYVCKPPTKGYARWFPTGRYSYQWIDFPNPDYPSMGNEEGRLITHPDGVPEQWEQNPVVTGGAVDNQAKRLTWAERVAAGLPPKGKDSKGPGKGGPAVNPNPADAVGTPSGGKGGKGPPGGKSGKGGYQGGTSNSFKGAGKASK